MQLVERKPIDATASALMVVLCALWGTQQVAVKLAAADMAPLMQIGLRSGAAALLIVPVILVRREQRAFGGASLRPGLLAGALFGLEFILIGEGLRFTSASRMSIFIYTAPIFAALGLHLSVREERLTALQWSGIAVAFAGVVLAFSGRGAVAPGDTAWIGDLLGLAAGATWALTTLAIRTRLAQTPATVTLWYQLAGACVLGVGAALVLGQTHVAATPILLASLAYQSVPIAAISYLVWFSLLRTYLASRLGVLSFMTPVFGIGFGVAILHDRLTLNFILGALLILAGILLVSGRDLVTRRRRDEQIPPPAVPLEPQANRMAKLG